MDIQEKSHALVNYTLGAAGISSPFWMSLINFTEFWMQYLTVLGGFILIIAQLWRTFKKKEK